VVSAAGLAPAEARELAGRLALPPTARRPLHPLLAPGVPVQSLEIDGQRTQAAAVAAIALFMQALGLPRRAREAAEQAADELIQNALYDAPGLAVPPRGRAGLVLPPGQRALVRCAGDERRFVIAVRDRFGALRRETVLHHLHRCAQAQAERRDPLGPERGGGVGLFLVAQCAAELIFRLERGRMTEVVCTIAAPPPRLRALLVHEVDCRA
jgi:hypothetical protein